MIRAKSVAALAAAAAIFCFAASANAGPASSGAANAGASTTSGLVEQVDRRGYRHCHWRGGVRRCHGGGYSYYGPRRYGYYGERRYRGPGLYLRFGSRDYDRRRRWR